MAFTWDTSLITHISYVLVSFVGYFLFHSNFKSHEIFFLLRNLRVSQLAKCESSSLKN